MTDLKKIFVCEWTFIGWRDLSIGIHVCAGCPYIDIHLPFGWLRIGWEDEPVSLPLNWKQCTTDSYGLTRKRRLIKALADD